MTRLAAALYRLRPDLAAAFPDVGGKHGKGYAHWFVEHAGTQEKFPAMFVTPVREALEGRRELRPGGGLRMDTQEGLPILRGGRRESHGGESGRAACIASPIALPGGYAARSSR